MNRVKLNGADGCIYYVHASSIVLVHETVPFKDLGGKTAWNIFIGDGTTLAVTAKDDELFLQLETFPGIPCYFMFDPDQDTVIGELGLSKRKAHPYPGYINLNEIPCLLKVGRSIKVHGVEYHEWSIAGSNGFLPVYFTDEPKF